MFPELRLNPTYVNEDIVFFNKTQLRDAQVFLYKGQIYRSNGKPFSTRTDIQRKGDTRVGDMVVMSVCGDLYSYPKVPGVFHHSSFLRRGVAFAGLWEVNEGRLEEILAWSGHYTPTRMATFNFLFRIEAVLPSRLQRCDCQCCDCLPKSKRYSCLLNTC